MRILSGFNFSDKKSHSDFSPSANSFGTGGPDCHINPSIAPMITGMYQRDVSGHVLPGHWVVHAINPPIAAPIKSPIQFSFRSQSNYAPPSTEISGSIFRCALTLLPM